MTLLEIVIVTVILALAASGLTFSLGALSRTHLKSGAGKVAALARYSYNRAVTHGTTVRMSFAVPGGTVSVEEAKRGITLARAKDREERGRGEDGETLAAIDPWASAKARLSTPLEPTSTASPFSAIGGAEGKTSSRFTNVALGRGVQIVKLIVPHEPQPLESGQGAVHFFPGGRTEHAVIQLGDGREGVFSVEIHALTGRARIYPEAYEPRELQDNPEDDDVSEVDAE